MKRMYHELKTMTNSARGSSTEQHCDNTNDAVKLRKLERLPNRSYFEQGLHG